MKLLILYLLLCVLVALNVHQTAAVIGTMDEMSDSDPSMMTGDDQREDESRVKVPVGNVHHMGQTRANVRMPAKNKAKKRPCGWINFADSNFATGDVNVDVGGFGIINGRINGC
ncbi:unnamed protein product [Adineta ricciae]|uniref:Uncharacterized protein n=1 Tax=Adineta ricciae TaxID=249248 RepID=A0A813MIW1_ADIRI|nr:unnamed protein product [Adineta ricciae]CAF1126033.1 unnamed protein product [Adineta ricciae]